jgi:hypothetical protein
VNNDFRTRILMPIVLPVVVLGTIAAFVGSVALILLYNTYTGALMLAAVAAAGILFTASLAASNDELGGTRRGVVLLAAALPILVSGAFAAGLVGDIDDADRMVNVLPLLSIPDDAPLLAAENSAEFCLLQEDGSCTATETWTVIPSEVEANLSFVFENLEIGVPHNIVITDLEGTPDDPRSGGETYAASTLITGPDTDYFVSDSFTWDDLPEQWYFFCAIHPNMKGVGQIVQAG